MTDRNELERLLAAASGNGKWRMRFVMDGNILIRTEAGSFVASGLVKEDATLIVWLHNNAQHYLALMDAAKELRDDMLERARIAAMLRKDDDIVVEAGNGVWFRFNEALTKALGEPK